MFFLVIWLRHAVNVSSACDYICIRTKRKDVSLHTWLLQLFSELTHVLHTRKVPSFPEGRYREVGPNNPITQNRPSTEATMTERPKTTALTQWAVWAQNGPHDYQNKPTRVFSLNGQSVSIFNPSVQWFLSFSFHFLGKKMKGKIGSVDLEACEYNHWASLPITVKWSYPFVIWIGPCRVCPQDRVEVAAKYSL